MRKGDESSTRQLTGETRIGAMRRLIPRVAHRSVRAVAVRVRFGLLRQIIGIRSRLIGEVGRRSIGRIERIRNGTRRKVTGERVLIEGGEERIVSVAVAGRTAGRWNCRIEIARSGWIGR